LVLAVPLVPKTHKWAEFALGCIAAAWAFALSTLFVRWEKTSLEDVGALPNRRSLVRLLIGFLIGLLLVAATAGASAVGGVRWSFNPDITFGAIMTPLATYLALSCREELAFHGYPLHTLKRAFGLWTAQFAVALLFAVEHHLGGYSWTHALFGAGLGSLVFGMAAIASRGLAIPIGIHAAWNFGQWTIGEKGASGIWTEIVPPEHEQSMYVIRFVAYIVVMSSAMCGFWLWYRRTQARDLRGE
jgi:membrane protease YdiL (CAAX protease family)